MKKYRRIAVNAFRRRVTIISGEWPRNALEPLSEQINDEVSLNDSATCEPVETDSPEGQLILLEAVRTIQRRLSPETRATLRNASEVPNAETKRITSICGKDHNHEKDHLENHKGD